MASVKRPGELAHALSELPVQVDGVEITRSAVPLPDYPDGPRPSSVLRLTGAGEVGLGENVAFSPVEHDRFARYGHGWLEAVGPSTTLRVGSALGMGGTAYERAALEAALIDLALRQAGLSLYDLTGERASKLRFVVSFAACADPQQVVRRLRDEGFGGDLKVDVDPSWGDATLQAIAREPGIAIFDFKGKGEPRVAQRLAELNGSALLEDPPHGFEQRATTAELARLSRDASLSDRVAVGVAISRGESVNLKAPRMGGPLELLRALDLVFEQRDLGGVPAAETIRSTSVYLGGMFEVGIGRAQARQLAALYCTDAPNDLAPNVDRGSVAVSRRANSPALVQFDEPGFGTR